MTANAVDVRVRIRRAVLAAAGIVSLVAALLVAGPLAMPARAVTISVADEQEFRDALDHCHAHYPLEDCEIEIVESFTISASGGHPLHQGNALTIRGAEGEDIVIEAVDGDVRFLHSVNANGDVTIENLTLTGFSGNESPLMLIDSVGLTLRNVTLVSNNVGGGADSETGLITVFTAPLTVENSIVADNHMDGPAAYGVFYATEHYVTIRNSVFTGNTALLGTGGVLYSHQGWVVIENSTFTENEANTGGAIRLNGGRRLHVVNSTFVDNKATFGSVLAVSIEDGFDPASLEYVTIVDSTGGPSSAIQAMGGPIQLFGSVLSGTSGVDLCTIGAFATVESHGYNWVTDDSCFSGTATDKIAQGDPQLEPLGDYGGPTPTMLPKPGSPLIDAIPDDEYAPATDQRGVSRTVGSGFDIGATEFDRSSVHFVVKDDDDHQVAQFTVYDATAVHTPAWTPVDPSLLPFPAGYAPGVISFDLDLVGNGATADVIGELADPAVGAYARIDGEWVEIEDAVDGTAVAFKATDGGSLDDAGAVDAHLPLLLAFTVPTHVSFEVHDADAAVVAEFEIDGAWAFSDVTWTSAADVTPAAPAGVAAPVGVIGFTVRVPQAGDAVTVTVTLAQPVNAVWKLVGGEWTAVTGATFSGTTVTYTLVDGGPLDDDGAANGVIVDPVLFGVAAAFTG